MKLSLALLSLGGLAESAKLSKTEKLLKRGSSKIRHASLGFLEEEGNSVISPLSIMGAMYLTAACTKPGSKSEREIIDNLWGTNPAAGRPNSDVGHEPYTAFRDIEKFLCQSPENPDDKQKYTLNISNGVFYQPRSVNLDQAKKSHPMDYFMQGGSTIQEHDFQKSPGKAVKAINKWVDETTNGKIKKIFDTIEADTVLVLGSSLYFKSLWKNDFTKLTKVQADKDGLCWLSQNDDDCAEGVGWFQQKTRVPYVQLKDKELDIEMNILEVPLGHKKFNDVGVEDGAELRNDMFVQIWYPTNGYLTDEDYDKRAKQFIDKNLDDIRTGQKGQRLSRRELKLTMPVISLETETDLIDELKDQGINSIFIEGKADFSPILGEKDEKTAISEVKHKVKFDMDEAGVEGAAVTASVLTSRTISTPKPIRIERPFYFFVSNRCHNNSERKVGNKGCAMANIPVFAGRVTNPTE